MVVAAETYCKAAFDQSLDDCDAGAVGASRERRTEHERRIDDCKLDPRLLADQSPSCLLGQALAQPIGTALQLETIESNRIESNQLGDSCW